MAKKIEMSDLIKKSLKDLVKLRNQERKSLFEAKLKNAVRSLNSPHIIKVLRRNIARINTVITQKGKEARALLASK